MRRLAFLLALAAVFTLAGCKEPTEEDRITKVLDEAAKSAEEGDANGVLVHIANDFTGPQGADKNQIKGILVREIVQGNRVTLTRRNLQIEVEGETAQVEMDALLTRKGKSIAPQDIGHWHFVLDFEKREKDWMIVKAAYQRKPIEDFIKP